jgi:ABC-type iron transport system FetAB permease component
VGSSVVDLGPGLGVALLALTALAAVAGRASGLGQHRPVVVAAARATAQLAAVSAVLVVVVDSLWLVTLFLPVMLVVAAATSAGRVAGRPPAPRGGPAAAR